MKQLFFAVALLALLPTAAFADNTGSKLYQCVTVHWSVKGEKFPPSVMVTVDIFGKQIAAKPLTMKDSSLDFEFEEDVSAKGSLSASFKEYDGHGTLTLDSLEAGCDFSGSYPIKGGKITDFTFTGRFDY